MSSFPRNRKHFALRPARFRGLAARLPAVAVLAGLSLAVAAGPAAGETAAWKTVPSPNPGPATAGDELAGVSCVSATFCVSVGDNQNKPFTGPVKTLIEAWNGTRWAAATSPSAGKDDLLFGVTCRSVSSCTAVGTNFPKTLVESWNGKSWTVVPSPNPGPAAASNELYAVSCVSATFCMAVGSGGGNGPNPDTALAETWNGKSWTAVPTPNPDPDGNFLYGVSCVSASFCVAAGYGFVNAGQGEVRGKTLIESWNGKTWSVASSPNPGSNDSLYGVSCLSATFCTAVGERPATTLAEMWNGTSWTVVPSPSRGTAKSENELSGVSCVSASACTAAGSYSVVDGRPPAKTLVESWNGTAWSLVTTPNPVNNDYLQSVSCVSATACTAAGARDTSSGAFQSLIESN